MTENNHQDSEEQHDSASEIDENDSDSLEKLEFIQSIPGRLVSVRGLVERIIEQFHEEHGEDESALAAAADSDGARRALVRDVADYIFGIESIQLGLKEQAQIIAQAYREIYSFGPLDALLQDARITTIALEGAEKVAVRYGPGKELQQLAPIFDDIPQMRSAIQKLLRRAGADLRREIPIIEAGLVTDDKRRICVSVASPSFTPQIAADIRIHQAQLPTLEDLVQSEFMPEKAAQLLRAIVQSEHGIILIGETESGKTTLLSILAQLLANPEKAIAVERACELRLPEPIQRLTVQWPFEGQGGVSFGRQIQNALDKQPDVLLLDEIRADEPESIAALLQYPNTPRQIWAFRGSSASSRIRSALGMVARMAGQNQPEAMVYELYTRLPFIVVVKRRRGYLQLREIAEWQFPDDADSSNDLVYADYRPLMAREWGELELSGIRAKKALDLPDDFWR